VGSPEDDAIAALVARSDLVVEGFDADRARRLAWAERHPALVVLSITPYGRSGPFAERPASGREGVALFGLLMGPRDDDGNQTVWLLDPNGEDFDIRAVEGLASQEGISLRTGCFCNPGAGEIAFGLTAAEIGRFFDGDVGMTFDELRTRIRGTFCKEIGAIRISVGLATTFDDVYHFMQFAEGFVDRTADQLGVVELEDGGRSKRDGA